MVLNVSVDDTHGGQRQGTVLERRRGRLEASLVRRPMAPRYRTACRSHERSVWILLRPASLIAVFLVSGRSNAITDRRGPFSGADSSGPSS
jgi:hypothetical protein